MIEIDDGELDALLADDPGGPVVMLNLLRFRPDGGRESYQRYAEALGGGINARYGLVVEYLGNGGRALVAGDGQAWDMAVLGPLPDPAAVAGKIPHPGDPGGPPLRRDALGGGGPFLPAAAPGRGLC